MAMPCEPNDGGLSPPSKHDCRCYPRRGSEIPTTVLAVATPFRGPTGQRDSHRCLRFTPSSVCETTSWAAYSLPPSLCCVTHLRGLNYLFDSFQVCSFASPCSFG